MKNKVQLKKKRQTEKTKMSFFTKTILQMIGASGLYIIVGLIMLSGGNENTEDFIRRQLFCNTDFKGEIISVFNKINSAVDNYQLLPVINFTGGIND